MRRLSVQRPEAMVKSSLAKTKRVARGPGMTDAEKAIDNILVRLKERGLILGIKTRCADLHATIGEIAGKSRSKTIVRARHAVWCWMHDDCGFSWPEIGALFGRSHDSIVHAGDKRVSKARKALEDKTSEKIATWLSSDTIDDEDPRSFVDVVDRERMAGLIRAGDWRECRGPAH